MWEYEVVWVKHGHELLLDARDLVEKTKGHIIEIGSERGEGSTALLATMAKELGRPFITVDMDENVASGAKEVLQKIDKNAKAVCQKGEDFLKEFEEPIGVLYLDGYDTMPPGAILPGDLAAPYEKLGGWSNEGAWLMHLKCVLETVKQVVPGGLVCFDDAWRRDCHWAERTKGYTAIPYLLMNGYHEIRYEEGAVLLERTVNA